MKAILWVVALIFGWMLIGAGEALSAPSFPGLLAAWAIASLIIALSQSKILGYRVETSQWWTITFIGIFMGLIVLNIISALIAMGKNGLGLAIALAIGGAIAGSVLGLLQFKFATNQKLSPSWILVSSLSWGLGAAAGYVIVNMVLCQFFELQTATILLLSEGITGGIIGVGTAVKSPLLQA